jgi:hypothetical protein
MYKIGLSINYLLFKLLFCFIFSLLQLAGSLWRLKIVIFVIVELQLFGL